MISLGDALKESMNRRCTFFGLTFRTGTKKKLGSLFGFPLDGNGSLESK